MQANRGRGCFYGFNDMRGTIPRVHPEQTDGKTLLMRDQQKVTLPVQNKISRIVSTHVGNPLKPQPAIFFNLKTGQGVVAAIGDIQIGQAGMDMDIPNPAFSAETGRQGTEITFIAILRGSWPDPPKKRNRVTFFIARIKESAVVIEIKMPGTATGGNL